MIAAAFALWVELLLREAAVYVIVLMLPLAFAALVWPARRIWAVRAVELLVALILLEVRDRRGAVARRRRARRAVPGTAASPADGRSRADPARGVLALGAAAALPLAELAAGVAGPLRGELRTGQEAADRSIASRDGRPSDALTRLAVRMPRATIGADRAVTSRRRHVPTRPPRRARPPQRTRRSDRARPRRPDRRRHRPSTPEDTGRGSATARRRPCRSRTGARSTSEDASHRRRPRSDPAAADAE